MSGVTGANRIKSRADFDAFVASYKPLIAKFPGFVDLRKSGSYNSDPDKQDFGDIDLIAHIQSPDDKATTKKKLQAFFHAHPETTIVPFSSVKHEGKRSYNSGEIVSVRYHDDQLGYSVQVDNIIASSDKEATFKQQFLDWPAEKQGLILGLVKIAAIETDPRVLFKKLGIHTSGRLESNQEYEFNLSSVELQLRKVTYEPGTFKQTDREVLWVSKNFDDVQKLLYQYDLSSNFDSLLAQSKQTIKNPRSNNRMQGVFSSMISVKSGEVGTPKGAGKEAARAKVAQTFGESVEKQYLWHGSRDNIPVLTPQQANDTGGNPKSNKKAIYATADKNFAIAMGLTEKGSDTAGFPNDPQLVLFKGAIRHGQMVYLHKLPMYDASGRPLFEPGGNDREFTSVPSVTKLKPIEVEEVPVDQHLNLIRQPTPKDWELRKKYMKKDVKESRSRLLNELIKPKVNAIVFDFVRFQPPTSGHELLIKVVQDTAKAHRCPYVIYVSKTQDHKKNPLSIDQKMLYLNKFFPGVNFVAAGPTTRTPIEAAKELNQKYTELIMVAGSDRLEGFKKLLNDYNHKEYEYNNIDVVSAGARDPDSDDVSGVRGTDVRQAALDNNFETFKQNLPSTADDATAQQLMSAVQAGLVKPERKVKARDLVGEANPNQQAAIYNPNGTTYRGEKMPTLDPDPVDDAEEFGPEHDEPYEQDYDKEKLKQAIAKHLNLLSKKEKMIMKLRFWNDMTLDEISAAVGVTRERIRQLEAKALRKLRYNSAPLQDFAEAKQRLDPKCWKGYKKSGTKMKGGTKVNNCVKIGEGWERQISSLIEQLKKK